MPTSSRPRLRRLGVRTRRSRRDILLQPSRAPRGIFRRAVHGSCAAHLERAAVSRAAALRDRPRRGQGHHRRRHARPRRSPGCSASASTVEHVIVVGDERRIRARRDPRATRSSSPPRRPASTGRIWTRPTRQPCATRAAPLATRRVSSTATARPYLHSLACTSSASVGISGQDRILVVVPQFHANAWGVPYAAWLSWRGPHHAQAVSAGRAARSDHRGRTAHLCRAQCRRSGTKCSATARGARLGPVLVPRDPRRGLGGAPLDDGALRGGLRGADRPGLGNDRDEPPGGGRDAPRGAPRPEERDRLPREDTAGSASASRSASSTGRATSCERDGTSVGEFEVRGPWVTAEYYDDPTPDRFRDGWLRTGDVGTLDAEGFLQITDRTKDVIKTGGEWISSVELENALMAPSRRLRGRGRRRA